ncbi:hypothetical protein C3B44_00650 [Corynebacterium yudongzhengii]|uniref:Phage holin family protein n=1 Tax=Corynebacterium yudongzhengii TaxID=2080740 RepID=A0A2U1T5M0_9CORY|nr:phage holin family protein [Corynebacterium yudongzhengii]AWB81037.1 hypothetical protein C3B44_00650 [Corynebacterium yudongzhengii]PWC01282.1 phage holin family protein [Corynebacterium yudongzhengii]
MRSVFLLILDVIIVALALWAVAALVPGVEITGGPNISREWTFVAVAAVFILVNSVLGTLLRVLGLPLTCLTLGLFALVINAAVFAAVAWISQQIGLGLYIDGFWPALFGAIVLALVRWALSTLTEGLRRA